MPVMPPPQSSLNLMDGKAVSEQVLARVKADIQALHAQGQPLPGLAVILAGDDPASQVYVGRKTRVAHDLGMHSELITFPTDVSRALLLETIDRLNADPAIHAILVQLPLPRQVDTRDILDRVRPDKDVDGFHPENLGGIVTGRMPVALPCTPSGIMTLLDHYAVPLEGQEVVVVGRSTIVGKPMGLLLLNRNATVTFCHSRTRDLAAHLRRADIVIAAAGIPEFIRGEHLAEGAVVVDVGINRIERDGKSRLVGDVHFDSAAPRARYITPVPGGVGPMTIATLMANTLALYRQATA